MSNNAGLSAPGPCLPDLLAHQVEVIPDNTAVICGDARLSYAELQAKSQTLAAELHALGVEQDHQVGMFVEPSLDLVVGAWGILFAGAAYLPLSPEYPEERLRFMIADSGAKVVFTQESLRARLSELVPAGTRIVTLDNVDGADGEPVGPRHDGLAYVIYTSGSTGKPKGVMIEHRAIVNQMRWLGSAHGLDHTKIVLQKTPMSFDAAQWEILAPAAGSTVVLGKPGVYRDPEGIIDAIRTHGITTLQCVPTLLQALVDTEELHTCTTLRQIFSGGEALSRNLAMSCLDSMPNVTLVNLYGPTECTINSSSHVVDRATLDEGPNSVSIGKPVDNTIYRILDGNHEPVSVGEVGELHIGGIQLARGYLHRPDLTAERFIGDPAFFKTGDLAYWNPDGTVQFVGRADTQVKLRGFRVELDEIKLAIETHDWVKNAAVLVKDDPRTGHQNLIACVELNPKEAALMDQGNAGAHHQSKSSRLQVRAQLSNSGVRTDVDDRETVDLPGALATPAQRRQAFARKTYRFYEGGPVTAADVLKLLRRKAESATPRELNALSFAEFGEILRYFGQHLSEERLLPKYGYASPGSLYATQLYFELHHVGDLRSGLYYYHPQRHQLVLISETPQAAAARVRVHFIGHRQAIEPVYRNNILEVLEIETGHAVGLFEEVLPGYGLDIRPAGYTPEVKNRLDCADDDHYLGSFELVPHAGPRVDDVEVYVQAHPGKIADLPAGQYRYTGGELTRVSDELVLRKHVIAINQAVYERASLGISLISRNAQEWLRYIDLGRVQQRLSMNDAGLGFMSSGYSSKSGHNLPSAKRITAVLDEIGEESGPSYFFVGGGVSDEQRRHEGMKEDVVHMKGPAEMIKDDLVDYLPDYMIPNKVVVLDALPLTANGKIDVRALRASGETDVDATDRPFIAPRTATERLISGFWKKLMRRETVSTQDDFFEIGGNSLIAVGLVNRINRAFGASLPLQVVFEAPTIEQLARRVERDQGLPGSRLVGLSASGTGTPVICWPGLGGYPMNLRTLASYAERPFFGVQAHGINEGETPYDSIREMAAVDVEAIKDVQPEGPYRLWGYSFGARLAFETAFQLEQAGDEVEQVFLIAPGSPRVRAEGDPTDASYDNKAFVTILYSVFAGVISGPRLRACLEHTADAESFARFIDREFPDIGAGLVRRIMRIVEETFTFEYSFRELAERRVAAPITIFKAAGDDYSFIENASGYSMRPPTVVELAADHYGLLREPEIGELVRAIHHRLEDAPAVQPHKAPSFY